ncbi:MAG: cobaltochelatase subunit CobN, partial [Peptococcaceae bacterium]|nr:cobaltochelatase subunit CobN [Peptococcaceae bacterium]
MLPVFLLPGDARAEQEGQQKKLKVFMVHSATSTKMLVDAAQELKEDPVIAQNVEFVIRSNYQVDASKEEDLKNIIADSGIVLLEWTFRPGMNKLLSVVESNYGIISPDKEFIVMQSELPLVRYNRIDGVDVFAGIPDDVAQKIVDVDKETDPLAKLSVWKATYSQLAPWCDARAYMEGTGTENYVNQIRWAINKWAQRNNVPELALSCEAPKKLPTQMIYRKGHVYTDLGTYITSPSVNWQVYRPTVGIIEYNSPVLAGNTAHIDALADQLESMGLNVLPVAAKYGAETYEAMTKYFSVQSAVYGFEKVDLVISCGSFSLGSGGAYEQTNAFLSRLDVPVLRAVTSTKRSPETWEMSSEGIPWGEVYYQIATSELQGITEPVFIAGQSTYIDTGTGAEITAYVPVPERIERLAKRAKAWIDLRCTAPAEKKVALIYYNYPPGKQNIGASYLAVPDSLLTILRSMQDEGYDVGGELPAGPEAMVDLLLKYGINVANWAPGVLDQMKDCITLWPVDKYVYWFDQQDEIVKKEMVEGPAGFIEAYFKKALALDQKEQALSFVDKWQKEMEALLRGAQKEQEAGDALSRMVQALKDVAAASSESEAKDAWQRFARAKGDFLVLGLPGLSGWGSAPGNVMVVEKDGKKYIAIPGKFFGNVFVGPQPQRGWEADAGKLYHSLVVPPTHQYLAFYAYLQQEFGANALVHIGRHSTYEWLPHKQALLTQWDYPDVVVSDLPSVYLYIVDGVGEGLQAKRRGLAVLVDHLTPPFETTRLYGDLLELKGLVENYEKLEGATEDLQKQLQGQYLAQIKEKVEALHLAGEIDTSLDGKDLVEEIHRYLVDLESTLMPYGLHVFGQDWSVEKQVALCTAMVSLDGGNDAPSLQRLLALARGINFDQASASELDALNQEARSVVGMVYEKSPAEIVALYTADSALQDKLKNMLETAKNYLDLIKQSFFREKSGLLEALAGRYVDPGPGNDPVRNPEVLPTGRNFYGLDPSTLPTEAAYNLGKKLADEAWARIVEEAAKKGVAPPEKVAAVVWCVETARDDGTMVSFVMRLVGVKPKWDKSKAVKGNVTLDKLSDLGRPRVDVVVTTSGLFRDIYGQVLVLLDRSFRSALAASYTTILKERPELSVALDEAMQPLRGAKLFDSVKGNDPLSQNYVARHWVESVSGMVYDLKNAGLSDRDAWSRAGILSMLRIFAPPVGDYGAGVSHAVEQAWTWDSREDIADLYLQRMGHAYSEQVWGENQAGIFKDLLTGVSNAFHSRSSNLYGVLDNDDCFDYFGGLSMAIERANGGKAPDMYILDYANPAKAGVMTFNEYITRELRTRYYNPEWIKGMMEYGYSGARTISNKFVSYLWGWQVTNPDTVKKWMWDEVADVYVRDKYGLGVNTWLSQGNNSYALISVTGTMLTAAQKGFWQADAATLKEIANTWAKAVIQ